MALQKSRTISVRTTETTVKSSLHYQQRNEDAALSIGNSSIHYSKVDELLLLVFLSLVVVRGEGQLEREQAPCIVSNTLLGSRVII